jgi:hypothetical protein
MNPIKENAKSENKGDNEEKYFTFLKDGPIWTNNIFLDWEPVAPGSPTPIEQEGDNPAA